MYKFCKHVKKGAFLKNCKLSLFLRLNNHRPLDAKKNSPLNFESCRILIRPPASVMFSKQLGYFLCKIVSAPF